MLLRHQYVINKCYDVTYFTIYRYFFFFLRLNETEGKKNCLKFTCKRHALWDEF